MGEGLRALVVDDDPPIRELLRTVLELDGWEVHEAEDGVQALALERFPNEGLLLQALLAHLPPLPA